MFEKFVSSDPCKGEAVAQHVCFLAMCMLGAGTKFGFLLILWHDHLLETSLAQCSPHFAPLT